jgi:hypothetical protein
MAKKRKKTSDIIPAPLQEVAENLGSIAEGLLNIFAAPKGVTHKTSGHLDPTKPLRAMSASEKRASGLNPRRAYFTTSNAKKIPLTEVYTESQKARIQGELTPKQRYAATLKPGAALTPKQIKTRRARARRENFFKNQGFYEYVSVKQPHGRPNKLVLKAKKSPKALKEMRFDVSPELADFARHYAKTYRIKPPTDDTLTQSELEKIYTVGQEQRPKNGVKSKRYMDLKRASVLVLEIVIPEDKNAFVQDILAKYPKEK